MTPNTDAFIRFTTNLRGANATIEVAKQKKKALVADFLAQIGLEDLGYEILQYGLPNTILVPPDRKKKLDYLNLIAPVRTHPTMDRDKRIIFSWVPITRVQVNEKIPLMKRILPIEGSVFPDAQSGIKI